MTAIDGLDVLNRANALYFPVSDENKRAANETAFLTYLQTLLVLLNTTDVNIVGDSLRGFLQGRGPLENTDVFLASDSRAKQTKRVDSIIIPIAASVDNERFAAFEVWFAAHLNNKDWRALFYRRVPRR